MSSRISSILSIGSQGSSYSDRSSNGSRVPSSVHPARPSREPSPRPPSPVRNLPSPQDGQTYLSPPPSATLSPSLQGESDAPPLLRPTPMRTESPCGSRPGSRPQSRAGSRPSSSRAASRPGSPTKIHPLTPTTEHKLSKRKSWLPGRLRKEAREGMGSGHTSQAWLVTPQEKIEYDLCPLTKSQRVCGCLDCSWVTLHAESQAGTRAMERRW